MSSVIFCYKGRCLIGQVLSLKVEMEGLVFEALCVGNNEARRVLIHVAVT